MRKTTILKPFYRLYKPLLFFAQIIFLFTIRGSGQQVTWGLNIGSPAIDYAQRTFLDPSGNVLVCGEFRGTNVDFDPSPATAFHTSNGQCDGFVAKYSSTGQYILSITIGGGNLDKIEGTCTDAAGNIYITGYFRGSNVDFDPSPATALLSSNGDNGGDPGYGGDMFLAKYTSTGQYLWAFNVGAGTLGDNGLVVKADPQGNVYVAGYFRVTPDFDPSVSTATLNSSSGTCFLAKYNSNGQYQWALNFGGGDIDNTIFDLVLDAANNVYVTGFFQGSNIDFDPSPSTAFLTSSGGFEGYVAKYTSNGQYVFAFKIGGFGLDTGRGITVDNSSNIYVVGDFNGSNIDFDPSPGTALLSSNGSSDVFVAKYTSNGQYIWAFNAGSGGSEIGYRITTDNTNVFITGGFSGVADFNPSAVVDNLTSNGGWDIFLAKYLANGTYQCAFNIGSSADDYGVDIQIAGNDRFYLAGGFEGSNVDFTPTPSTYFLNSNGNRDAFLVKYYWPPNTLPTGTIAGNTICPGQNAQLTFNSLTGTSPFTVTYSDGTNVYTQTNVQSGVPFNVQVNPTATTTYTVILIQDAVRCSPGNNLPGLTATVTVNANCDPCNNWLYVPTLPGAITVGDLDVTGNQITVEAQFNRTVPLNSGAFYGHLVSKHTGTTNVNYALLPNGCEITTSVSGYTSTFQTCPPLLNKTYHVAMVYDGSTLKFYRDGFLLSQQPCTGNMTTNNLATTIAQISSSGNPLNNQFLGYVNEVRIWNVARTQNELRTFMNAPLPNPTTQAGLLGYYSFNSLINKQGNAAYNGTINGSPVLNSTNPQCELIIDSCDIVVSSEEIINDYTPVLSLDPCKNIINVGDASAFNVGDTVLLIQMKGAVIDSSNTSAFGTITDYKNAGNYEFNYVKSKNSNSIELLNGIEKPYDLPGGKAQLIRVPYFQNYTVTNTLSCLPWNGSVGGVLVFNVQNSLTLNNKIDVSGKGFKGGLGFNSGQLTTNCGTNGYFYPAGSGNIAGIKGESITTVSNNIIRGKGALAGAGGGGLDHNSGGGGGANGGSGGFGGYQLEPCGNAPFDNRGVGGKNILYSNAANKIFMGSGGGAGHANNPANLNYPASGGNGGGIIIISAQSLQTNSFNIIANGNDAPGCSFPTTNDCHDAMGGGGAGGTILLKIPSYNGNTTIQVKGGKGADMTGGPVVTAGRIGPGGGGGGGVYWSSTSSLPANTTVNSIAGAAGVLTTDNNNPWGATAGTGGINLFNLQLPIDNTLFKPNIDSVRIKDSLKSCTDFDFKGLAYTNANPIATWQWYFGDGGTASTQNTSHSYAPGNFTVKLVVTDINGCKDSITRNVIASTLTVNAGNDTTICSGQSVTLQATTNGGTQFQWNNSSLLNNSTILNPVATPLSGLTPFIITASNAAGCSRFDTVNILVRSQSTFSINAPSPICPNGSAQLLAQGGDTYQWSPSSGINSIIPNPVVNPSITTTYTVQITDTVCNQTQNLSTQVVVLQLPNVQAFKQNDIDCMQVSARLNATGAMNYKWLPSTSLNNPNISNPTATPTATTTFTVEGTDAAGCKNTDTITVVVDFSVKNGLFLVPNAFTPNNDGLNDCFGIKHWGVLEDVEFNIYNRWGELVFHTTDASKCWDGTWKNLKQDPGVFVYWIRAKSLCGGNVFRKGTVLLIR